MTLLYLWCLILGVGYGYFSMRWGRNDIWSHHVYGIYCRLTRRIDAVVAVMDSEDAYDSMLTYLTYSPVYYDYLKAHMATADDMVSLYDQYLKKMGRLYLKSYWLPFVLGLLFGGVFAPHMYLLGIILFISTRYITHHYKFVLHHEPLFFIATLQSIMLEHHYAEIGEEIPRISEDESTDSGTIPTLNN